MKKFASVVLVIACFNLHAQFVNQLNILDSFSVAQVDSLLTSQGVPSGVIPIKYPIKVYQMVYNTVSWDSSATIASGLFCVPVGLPCKTALISYAHGTETQTNQVPSFLNGSEWFLGLAFASVGYVTVMPDYLGMGVTTVPLHPYQHAHTEATATIDLIRAAKDTVAGLGAPVDDQLFLMGYSQGGHATMAAHQLIQAQLDNTMHVTASAPMSGAYDMGGVMADLLTSGQPYPAPYYLPFLVLAYNEVYNIFPADSDFFIHPYDVTLPPLFYNGGSGSGQIDDSMPASGIPEQIMQPLLIDSFVADSGNNNDTFRDILRENDTYNWVPTSPVHMFGCDADQYVPFENAKVAYQHFIQNGTPASLIDTVDASPTSNHVPCANFAILDAVLWFQTLTYQPLTSLGITAVNDSSSTDSTMSTGSAAEMDTLGNPPYTYLWSNGDTTATATGLSAGPYYVTVTDRSLCTVYDTTVIHYVPISSIQNEVLTNVRVFPNPSNGMVNIQNLDPSDNIKTTEVYDMSGRLVKTYSLRQANNIQLYFDNDAQGVYYLYMRSEAGKEVRAKIVVME